MSITKKRREYLERHIELMRAEMKRDPQRHFLAILHGYGFTFYDDIYQLYTHAKKIGASDIAFGILRHTLLARHYKLS